MLKAVLILGLVATTFLIFRAKPSAARLAFMRLGGATVLTLGVIAVLLPQSVTTVAQLVGVGRGTDLVLYVLVIAFLLTSAGLYRKVSELEDRYVDLVRHLALSAAVEQESPAAHADTEGQRGFRSEVGPENS